MGHLTRLPDPSVEHPRLGFDGAVPLGQSSARQRKDAVQLECRVRPTKEGVGCSAVFTVTVCSLSLNAQVPG